MEKVKLIWDFRGPDANATAEHHIIHLKEFAEKENLVIIDYGIEPYSDLFQAAYIITEKSNLEVIKQALKPHRGQLVN